MKWLVNEFHSFYTIPLTAYKPIPLYFGGLAFSSSCNWVLTYSVGKVMQISMPPAIPPGNTKEIRPNHHSFREHTRTATDKSGTNLKVNTEERKPAVVSVWVQPYLDCCSP